MQKRTAQLTVVFDLDGTIADTAGDLIVAANRALAAEGFAPAPDEAIRVSVGNGAKAMILSGLSALGCEPGPQQLDRLVAALIAHYAENIAVKTRLYPGFEKAARGLRRQGIRLALCTNKRERLTLKLLSALRIEIGRAH